MRYILIAIHIVFISGCWNKQESKKSIIVIDSAILLNEFALQQEVFYPIMTQDSAGEFEYIQIKNDSVLIVGDTINLIKEMAKFMQEQRKGRVVIININDTIRLHLGDTIRIFHKQTDADFL